MKLEIIETDKNFFTVIVDDKFADRLTKDEALGVVASALFSDKPIFVKTYEQWSKWNSRFGVESTVPIALLGKIN